MTTEFSAQFHEQWMITVRNLFDRGMSGWRFEPPLSGEISDAELGRWLGTHNLNCVVFRSDSQEIVGCKLSCQCTDCMVAQAELVISCGSQFLGLGAHSTSIVFERENSKAVQFLERDRSALEDAVEARKLAERQRDLREKAFHGNRLRRNREEI